MHGLLGVLVQAYASGCAVLTGCALLTCRHVTLPHVRQQCKLSMHMQQQMLQRLQCSMQRSLWVMHMCQQRLRHRPTKQVSPAPGSAPACVELLLCIFALLMAACFPTLQHLQHTILLEQMVLCCNQC
jgi:hypothetical protein